MKVIGPIIIAHGGAGFRAMTSPQAAALRAAIEVGYHLLDRGLPALIAVEQTIRVLERSGLFNAGNGARLQLDGVRRMDASIMEGCDLRAGAVASIQGIVHPITAARLVIEQTNHVLLVGAPATTFARCFNLNRQPQQPHRHLARRINLPRTCSRETLRLYRDMMGGEVYPTCLSRQGNRRGGSAGSVWHSCSRCVDRWHRCYVAQSSRRHADHRGRGVC